MSEYIFGQIVGKILKNIGVEHVFGMPGHGNLGLIDGLDKEGMVFITCHHETVAGMAADGYFRSSGRPGVAIITCGPGAFNMQLAAGTAAQDSSAVIFLAGDVPLDFAGKTAYEEFDLHGDDDQFFTLRNTYKKAWKIIKPHLFPGVILRALNTALFGRPGPVLVDIPFELQTVPTKAFPEQFEPSRFQPTGLIRPDAACVDKALSLLCNARFPVIVAGNGIRLAGAGDELAQFSESLGVPVVTSLAGSGCIPSDHPNALGTIGSYGLDYANRICLEADVILAIGTRFEESETAMWTPNTVFNIPPTRLIQIDIEHKEIGKNYPVEVGMVADAKAALKELLLGLQERKIPDRGDFLEECYRNKRKWLARFGEAITSNEVPLNPRRVLATIEKYFPENGIMCLDPSWPRIGFLQQTQLPRPDNLYIVSGLLPIGWSPAAALGVKVANPQRPVISVSGDGGFLLSEQVLGTAVQYDLPIVWIILNNYGYNALGVLQNAYFKGREVGSFFSHRQSSKEYSPNYSQMAKAYGAEGERIARPEEIEPAIKRAFQSGRPFVLDFVVSRQQSRLIRTAPVTWEYFWER